MKSFFITLIVFVSILLKVLPDLSFNSNFSTLTQLPECPQTPNCYKSTIETSFLTFEEAALAVNKVLQSMNAEKIEFDLETNIIHSVFRIPFFGWRDDFHVQFIDKQDNIHINIRSASRSGNYDLGVNKRRINKFIKGIDAQGF